MPSADLLLAFALATATFAVFPGPALLYTAAQTLARGRRAGFLAVAGIHLGCYAHVLATTCGLSAALQLVPALYLALKIAGALYLVWLGIGMIRQARATVAAHASPTVVAKSDRRAFVESVVVELTNPKVALFFLAFLPQFVDPAATLPVWTQFLILGTIVNFAFSSADCLTVLAASSVARRLGQGSRASRFIRYAGGSVMIGLGLKLAADRA